MVAEIQVIQQVPRGTRNELQRTLRQNARLQHQAHTRLGDKTGWGCRLHNAWHTSNKRRRELLQHAPDGEVERINLHSDARNGGVNVAANKGAVLGKDLRLTISNHVRVRHLTATLGRNGEHGRNAAVNVDEIIPLIRARFVRQLVKLITVVLQEHGQFFNLQRTLMNGQLLQVLAANGAGIINSGSNIQSFCGYSRHNLTRGWVSNIGDLRRIIRR